MLTKKFAFLFEVPIFMLPENCALMTIYDSSYNTIGKVWIGHLARED